MRSGCIVVALFTFFSASASASNINELDRFEFPNPVARDHLYGFTTSLLADMAFVGAPGGRFQSGAGFILDVTSGNQNQVVPSARADNDFFGFSSALNREFLAVGEPSDPFADSPLAGSVFVFDHQGTELRQVRAADEFGGNEFGFGIDLSEDFVIVGGPALGQQAGSAYLFDPSDGSQIHKLVSSESRAGDEFGWNVAVEGNYAMVGAPGNFDTLGLVKGQAFVFDVGNGKELFKLESHEGEAGDEFGFAVDINDRGIAVVGAPDAGVGAGSAYLFDLNTGQQLFRLQASDSRASNDFGSAVAIVDNVAIVGARGQRIRGAAYVFDVNTGLEIGKLVGSDVGSSDTFAGSVSIGGNRVIVGAPRDDNGAVNSGSVYEFQISLPGDFDDDGELTVADLDALTERVNAGDHVEEFDVNADGQVDRHDRKFWVEKIEDTYFGDSNLDGEFDTSDLLQVFAVGEYRDGIDGNSTWAEGDWNGDWDFGIPDLILAFQGGGYQAGPRHAVHAVPEPVFRLSLWTVAGMLLCIRYGRSRMVNGALRQTA